MYYTSSDKLADDFMRLCLHAGWSQQKDYIFKAQKNIIKGRKILTSHNIWNFLLLNLKQSISKSWSSYGSRNTS
jgi:hypothetical protein